MKFNGGSKKKGVVCAPFMKRCDLKTVHRCTIYEGYVCITKHLFWPLFNVTHPPTSEISGPLFPKRIHLQLVTTFTWSRFTARELVLLEASAHTTTPVRLATELETTGNVPCARGALTKAWFPRYSSGACRSVRRRGHARPRRLRAAEGGGAHTRTLRVSAHLRMRTGDR